MARPNRYSAEFFSDYLSGSRRSAEYLVPHLIELTRPSSVVDVGCGVGTWAAEFLARGIRDVIGVDGPYVQPSMLQIPRDLFHSCDLSMPFAASLGRRFDLAVCLEVAEHIPQKSADLLIDSLTALADTIVFSAAIPGQGGTNHINEQWPEYWASKFNARGFSTLDTVRGRFWNDSEIEYWYRQNMILYSRDSALLGRVPRASDTPLNLVHPECLAAQAAFAKIILSERDSLRWISKNLSKLTWAAIGRRLHVRAPRGSSKQIASIAQQ